MVPLNYNFIVTCLSMHDAMRNLQCIPIACLCGACFLVALNIHVSYNLLCATRRIVMHGVATCVTATQRRCFGKYLTMPYHKNATLNVNE